MFANWCEVLCNSFIEVLSKTLEKYFKGKIIGVSINVVLMDEKGMIADKFNFNGKRNV